MKRLLKYKMNTLAPSPSVSENKLVHQLTLSNSDSYDMMINEFQNTTTIDKKLSLLRLQELFNEYTLYSLPVLGLDAQKALECVNNLIRNHQEQGISKCINGPETSQADPATKKALRRILKNLK